VSTSIIKIIYVLGLIGVTLGGLIMLFEGGIEAILAGLGMITLGNLLWRVSCEAWILLFSMHDTLGSIERHLKASHWEGESKGEATCPKCGTVNIHGAKFCEHCGIKI